MPVIDKIILGTVQLGIPYGINNDRGLLPMEKAVDLLCLAYGLGIRTLDTAEAYGTAQQVIGEFHKNFPAKRFDIVTKYASSYLGSRYSVVDNINKDIAVLNVDKLSGYMFHSYSDYVQKRNELGNLSNLKNEGLIEKLGVSLYTNDELEHVISDDLIDFIQLPFNVLDNSGQRGCIIKKAKDLGKEIHVRSVFLQGLFFKNDPLPDKLIPLSPYLNKMRELAESHQLQIDHLALNYAIQQPNVDKVLIGVDTADHLRSNIKLAGYPISQELISEVDKIRVKEITLLNPANWN